MRIATVDVGGMITPLSDMGVERQLRRLRGVHGADVDYATASATVEYDERVIDLTEIKSRIRECGYHCAGVRLPAHVCKPGDPPGDTATAVHVHRPAVRADQAMRAASAPMAPHDAMAHEMGHGAGMDMQEMVRDMRNRFWIALIFTVPIFVYSPMGGMFMPPAPPFGLRLDFWLFLLATVAVVYPAWPFVVAAFRCARGRALARDIAQDAPESILGGRVQRRGVSYGRRRLLSADGEP